MDGKMQSPKTFCLCSPSGVGFGSVCLNNDVGWYWEYKLCFVVGPL